MRSRATTVEAYLASLPEDRRAAMSAVRAVILKNLDKDYAEGMQYGMIGYCVPHRVFPAGYHCDPKQPLPFAGLGSGKAHMSLHLMCVYMDSPLSRWFRDAWAKTGKKLDMGAACVRFKKVEDVVLEVIGEAIRRVPAKQYIATYTANLGEQAARPAKGTRGKKAAVKKASKKKTGKKKAARRAS
jgi:hypothetical protein